MFVAAFHGILPFSLRRGGAFLNLPDFMTSPSPAENQTKDQTDAVVAPDFAAEVQTFWEKNRTIVLALCAVVLLAIVGFEVMRYLNKARDENAQEAFAKAAGAPERLDSFAKEHSGHVLASVALLQVADAKYVAGDYAAALSGYQKVAQVLTHSALKERARLGAAVSRIGTGDQAGAQTELKALSADTATDKNIRAEATYHLATLANEAGRTDEVRSLLEEISKLDAMGIWAQRATQLRASLTPESPSALTLKP